VSQITNPRFDLWRYFSLASLLVFVIATVIVGILSYYRAREALLRSSEEYVLTDSGPGFTFEFMVTVSASFTLGFIRAAT